ncbi:helix-turn-helix domain-containing protein [Sphaerisporangium sp. NPDC004334]
MDEADAIVLAGSLVNDPSELNFLTAAEVATLMRVSKMTVYRLVHSGQLPALRVGRSFHIPEQAVHDYIAQQQHQAIS